jgi:hypothetical protein
MWTGYAVQIVKYLTIGNLQEVSSVGDWDWQKSGEAMRHGFGYALAM